MIRQGEGLSIELKQARKGLLADLFETVCAFLNKQGGHVLLGVKVDGTVTGVAPEQVDQLKKEFTTLSNNPTKLNPPFLLEFTSVTVAGQAVLYVYVPQSSQVHRCGGAIFDRAMKAISGSPTMTELVRSIPVKAPSTPRTGFLKVPLNVVD
ncbi:AlbA family DNA-binding domain-containing protein [Rufibacter immobilis]|uniref:AlbA family DNA-binding domain-containing protein n=1 Tax=Rufibacter immobilis TaxID=1348778 RepID=UPI0035ECA092